MQVIYKYPLPVKEKYVIELPANAIIIRVDDVDGLFYLNLVAERLNHIETINNSKTIIKQREDFISKINFSLDIIKPGWQNK